MAVSEGVGAVAGSERAGVVTASEARAAAVLEGAGVMTAFEGARAAVASEGVGAVADSAGVRAVVASEVAGVVAESLLCRTASMRRRGSLLLAAAHGWRGHLSRPAARWGRGFPGPAPTTPEIPHRCTPVPTLAHPIPRAIRVRRSPR